MPKCPKCKKELPFLIDKKMVLLFSFYLSLGSVALFIFINSVYTTIQALLWKYSETYILNSMIILIIAFVAGVLFIITCFCMLQSKKFSMFPGFIGCAVLIIYPTLVLFIGKSVPSSFNYLLIILLPIILLFLLSLLFRKKKH